MKCPKCGEEKNIEVLGKIADKVEIYCNTCGKVSILPYQPKPI